MVQGGSLGETSHGQGSFDQHALSRVRQMLVSSWSGWCNAGFI